MIKVVTSKSKVDPVVEKGMDGDNRVRRMIDQEPMEDASVRGRLGVRVSLHAGVVGAWWNRTSLNQMSLTRQVASYV